ncbi:MAG: methyltransferase domain-containing protein [Hyphomonadaceae bacterium]
MERSDPKRQLSDISRDQRAVAIEWLTQMGRTDMSLIEVGCGSGWLCPWLKPFGRVTATDLSDKVLSRARKRVPDVNFVAGDFMALEFDAAAFDVVVTIEMLSHVADQDAFIAKLTRLLKPGGVLILATQNKPVLRKHNTVHPAKPGQLRRWVDRSELERLLSRHLRVQEIRAITPNANKGPMRLIAGRAAKKVMRKVAGRAIERRLEAAGFGWTLMALAQKPGEAPLPHAN